jgi:transcriptional regulator with XRE-family HTH domain
VQTKEEDFGKFLRGLRMKANLTQRDLEKRSGVSNAYLSQVESNKRGIPSPEILIKLAPVLDITYESLLRAAGYLPAVSTLDKTGELLPIKTESCLLYKVYKRLTATDPDYMSSEPERDEDTNYCLGADDPGGHFFFLQIQDDNMAPTLVKDDLVLVREQAWAENNQLAIVIFGQEDASVRRVAKVGETNMLLVSDNPSCQPVIIPADQCRIIGIAVKKITGIR